MTIDYDDDDDDNDDDDTDDTDDTDDDDDDVDDTDDNDNYITYHTTQSHIRPMLDLKTQLLLLTKLFILVTCVSIGFELILKADTVVKNSRQKNLNNIFCFV